MHIELVLSEAEFPTFTIGIRFHFRKVAIVSHYYSWLLVLLFPSRNVLAEIDRVKELPHGTVHDKYDNIYRTAYIIDRIWPWLHIRHSNFYSNIKVPNCQTNL